MSKHKFNNKKKENRSDWVAVEPERTSLDSKYSEANLPTVTPAITAYQFFQRENSQRIRDDLIESGESADVGSLGRAISRAWRDLDANERSRYEEMGNEDRFRFRSESHARDVAVTALKERLRRERDEIIITGDGGRSTRGQRRREIRKAEKRAKRELNGRHNNGNNHYEDRKRKKNEKKQTRTIAKKKTKTFIDSDEEEYYEEDDEDDDEEEGDSVEYNDESSSESESESEGFSSSSDNSSDSSVQRRKTVKKKAPRQVSAAVQAKRDAAKREKEIKEKYIVDRQQDLRNEKSEQAKKRLDFLIKQSDIFRHFGKVKEDSGKYFSRTRSSNLSNSETSNSSDGDAIARTSRRDTSSKVGEMDPDELEQVDEHEATFLTSQPSTLGFGKMRPYQIEGLNWMIRLQENGVNGILADEMGLGKTLQSISVLVYMLEYLHVNGPHLIIVPKSTLSNWMNEFGRWAPTLKPIRFHGNKEERDDLAKNILQPGQRDEDREWNVCVTTYEICNLDKAVLNKFAWSYLIIDEAHRLKNEASAFSQTIRTFETRYRLLLTGTPLQNNLHELWALLNFLVPDVFASSEQFDEWFNLDIDDVDEKNKLISQLHKILRPFMIRRLKADVEKSLPPKHETILFTGMSVLQKKLYKDILLRDIDVLRGGQGGGGSGNRSAVLNIVMQLRKCAGHPYLFPGIEDRSLPPLGEHLVENCGKMVLLDKLLVRLKELGHRVLLFTQMTRILDILEDYLFMRQFPYCRIDGNTDYEKREESIDTFNAPNSDKFIFLLSTRAGGLGINLQTADVVILYDSDWNPQADLQAQDRAHRIGQKKEVQVFRLVTEHTVEEKVVERAQQKLKLDAMVVQQGRLKEKDKLSRDELIEAVRFGADKVFKSKDSSITDDDIDLILEAGKEKTEKLNQKLQVADKGDMLDFKFDAATSTQTFEGVDYSKQGQSQIKAAQAQAELMGILDMGKRERRTVANYNEDQLFRQHIEAKSGPNRTKKREKNKDTIRLPKHLRLPRLDEWQMFDRDRLYALQEIEETAFRALSEEMQQIVKGKKLISTSNTSSTEENTNSTGDVERESVENEGKSEENHNTEATVCQTKEDIKGNMEGEDNRGEDQEKCDSNVTKQLGIEDIPPLLSPNEQAEKDQLLAEGFADWGRRHYTAYLKASAKYGRNNFPKIANDVGKPISAIEDYAAAFWDENMGKKRFSESEYDRSVKTIERGEKKLLEIKALQRGTRMLISLFENPWRELEFTHVNIKDKFFTLEEDRHLLCWAHKYGYGQWLAVKLAIRRSPQFRFDYYLRSLPVDALGRRCEQLMKAAEKEIEHMEKEARANAGWSAQESENKVDIADSEKSHHTEQGESLQEVKLPSFKEMKILKQQREKEEKEKELKILESKVEEIESQMEEVENRLKFLDHCSKEMEIAGGNHSNSSEFPEELLPELANLVANSGFSGPNAIANDFCTEHKLSTSKKLIMSKIDEIAKKEKKVEEGDTRAVWHLLPEYMNLLSVETIRHLRKEKEERLERLHSTGKKNNEQEKKSLSSHNKEDGALGPDGEFVPFPEYDGSEIPRENKKAFTLFCNATRKEVKRSLDAESRKDKSKVNGILKKRWYNLDSSDKSTWKKWEQWDAERHARDLKIFEDAKKAKEKKNSPKHISESTKKINGSANQEISIPKKKRDERVSIEGRDNFHIPKKRRS